MDMDAPIYHSNKYAADAACHHCDGVVRHERWCFYTNEFTAYCSVIVDRPEFMNEYDKKFIAGLLIKY